MSDRSHPNVVRTQQAWDAVARGELGDGSDFADKLAVENGPGAGPWRVVEGKNAFFEFVLKLIPFFGDSWHQDGTCIYADDGCSISPVHETGQAPDGESIPRPGDLDQPLRPHGLTDRIWMVYSPTKRISPHSGSATSASYLPSRAESVPSAHLDYLARTHR